MASSLTKRLYDTYRSSADKSHATAVSPYFDAVVRRHFPADRGAPILDLGCGAGELLGAAMAAGYIQLVGVDWSNEQVTAAHEAGRIMVRQGDLFDALRETADASQGVVAMFDVLEHLDRDVLATTLDHVLRVLRADGRLIAHVPNAESPMFGRVRYGDATHVTAFSRQSCEQVFKTIGFARVECFEDAPVIHGAKSAIRFVAWKAIRSALAAYLTVESGTASGAIFSQNLLAVAHK